MKKKITTLAVIVMMFVNCGMTVFAAPKTMPDGGIFDATYYAEQNADVVSALGSDEAVLYKHYLEHGKAEGRKPYADSSATTKDSKSKIAGSAKGAVTPSTSTSKVWKTKSGKKYHSINNCGKTDSSKAVQITLEEAEKLGLGKCSKCW